MERKINLEEIIQKETDFVSKSNEQVYNIQDIKLCMKEFGKQLLELAAENAKIEVYESAFGGKYTIYTSSKIEIDRGEYGIVNTESITNTINQVE